MNPRLAEIAARSPGPAERLGAPRTAPPEAKRLGDEFAGVLHERLPAPPSPESRLKVSAHAQARLGSRNIALGEGEWARVMSGVEKAAAKGAKESLLLLDGTALVVSVRNRTLITAVDAANTRENVFTNIDSAVIV